MQDINILDDEIYALISKHIKKDIGILEFNGDKYFTIRDSIIDFINAINKG